MIGVLCNKSTSHVVYVFKNFNDALNTFYGCISVGYYVKKPSTLTEKPSTMTEKPSKLTEKPSTMTEKISTMTEQPFTMTH